MAKTALIDDLERQFVENPRRVFARLANEYRKQGDLDHAIEICRAHVPQQPTYISGHIVLGQALFERGEREEAGATFATALGLDPENLIALRHLGDIAREDGDVDAARSWYHRLLDVDPQNEDVTALLESLDTRAADPAEPPSAEEPSAVSWSDINPEQSTSAAPAGGDEAALGSQLSAEERLSALGHQLSAQAVAESGEPMAESREPPFESQEPSAAPSVDPAQAEYIELTGDEPTFSSREPRAESREPLFPDLPTEEPVELALDDIDLAPANGRPGDEDASPSVALDLLELPPAEASSVDVPDEPASAAPIDLPEPVESPFEAEMQPDVAAPAEVDTGAAAAPVAPVSEPFVTESMAELYVHQGFVQEGLAIYRALVQQRPEDAQLRERMARVEESVAAAAAGAPSPSSEAASRRRPERTIRDVLQALAQRRAPVPRGGERAGATKAELVDLFPRESVPPQDAEAAGVLAAAFGDRVEGRGQSLAGEPTRAASTELSLDALFGEGRIGNEPASPAETVSFDQFFSKEDFGSGGEGGEGQDAGAADEEQSSDLELFHAWLEGLKK